MQINVGLDIIDFNPHSPCGERLQAFHIDLQQKNISIHTPHAGSDTLQTGQRLFRQHFNPHSPCGERPYCF